MPVKKTNKQFKNEVYALVGDEYTFLGDYVNTRTKLEVIHNTCGNSYKITPKNFLSGSRCHYCYLKSKRTKRTKWTDEIFKSKVYELVGDEYTFLEAYVNMDTKIEVVHNTCGNRYIVKPERFIGKGRRCPACNGGIRLTNDIFLVNVKEEVGDEYTFLESYVNNKTKLVVEHNVCGHRYKVAPKNFLLGSRCPACSESKGERKIADYLDKQGIIFEREKTFSDLKVINNLRYDFAIYHKGELLTLIEYDGKQHFVAVDLFGGEERLLKTQEHDRIKNEYAKQNNIPLLRIPYNKYDNIEEIIDRYLSDHF